MKVEVWCAKWHTFFEFIVIPKAHAKHSEMLLVPAPGPRRMRLAMFSRNVCNAFLTRTDQQ
jgi:hypothetical protein